MAFWGSGWGWGVGGLGGGGGGGWGGGLGAWGWDNACASRIEMFIVFKEVNVLKALATAVL